MAGWRVRLLEGGGAPIDGRVVVTNAEPSLLRRAARAACDPAMDGQGTGEGERAGGARGRPGTDGPITFIVRVSIDEEGGVTHAVERVRTGQKERVHGVGDIGRIIAMMIAGGEGRQVARRGPPPGRRT